MTKYVPTFDDCVKVDKMLNDNNIWAEDVWLVNKPFGKMLCI